MERFNCNILVLRRALNENSIISSSHSVTSYKALCRLYTNFTSKDVFMHTAEYLVTCFVLATVMQYRHHCQFSTTKFFYSNRINDLLLFLFCFVFLFSASRCFFSLVLVTRMQFQLTRTCWWHQCKMNSFSLSFEFPTIHLVFTLLKMKDLGFI